MEKLKKGTDVRLVSNRKDYLKLTSKLSYMSQKIFDIDLVVIRKSKVTLTLIKSAYVEMRILNLSKVLMYEFPYDYLKNKYGINSRLLFTDTDSLICKIKTKDIFEDFSKKEEMIDFSNYSFKSTYFDN